MNTLEWSVDKDGKYQLKFIRFSYLALEVEGRESKYYFDISTDILGRINSDAFKCELFVEKNTGIDDFSVTVNGEVHKYNFGGSSVFTSDICPDLIFGLNELKISSAEKMDVKQLGVRLVLK
jgi:hypothetical protein